MSNNDLGTTLLPWAIAWLANRVTGGIVKVEQEPLAGEIRADALVTVDANNVSNRMFVELRSEVSPRMVAQLVSGPFRRMRSASYDMPVLVVAPFLSKQTQAALRAENLNYLDQTGNALIQLKAPVVYIETQGANTNPNRTKLSPRRVTLRGTAAARIIRMLIDVTPPYSVTELARATGLDLGNTSKLLNTLNEFGAIGRGRRGRVLETDIRTLFSLWAETYSVMRTNRASLFIAPQSASQIVNQLVRSGDVFVTGSFARTEATRVTARTLLMAYTDDSEGLATRLGLLPTEEAANVVLLEPFDQVVTSRFRRIDNVRYAALSQVAIDCLTGPGRMPAEGSALVDWMLLNEDQWRLNSLDDISVYSDAKVG